MSKIKVLHITFDMTIGGAQQVILQLMKHMDDSKIKSSVACIDGCKGEFGNLLEQSGHNVYLFNRQAGLDKLLIKELRKLIQTEGINIVHCHQYTPYFYGLLASLFTKAKVIFTEHGRFFPDFGTWKRKLVNPILTLFTYKITSISQATKKAMVKYENFPANKIEVVYNGIEDKSSAEIDASAIKKQFSIPENVFIFGTISRLQPIKNQVMMIKSFNHVHKIYKGTHLLIVGDGESRQQLEILVDELKLHNSVTFTGFQTEAYRFHKIIDVFLLTSFSEGTSMTVLEAMSFSKPCIVTNVGGNPELIQNNFNGYVVESNDESEFAKKSIEILNDKESYKMMSIETRKIYLNKFLVSDMSLKFNQLYLKSKVS